MPALEAQAELELPKNNIFDYKTYQKYNLLIENSNKFDYYKYQQIALHSILAESSKLILNIKIGLHNICTYFVNFIKNFIIALHNINFYSGTQIYKYKIALHSLNILKKLFHYNYQIALHNLCVNYPIFMRNYKIAFHSLCTFYYLPILFYQIALHNLLTFESKTSKFLALTPIFCVPQARVPTIFKFTYLLYTNINFFTKEQIQYYVDLNFLPSRILFENYLTNLFSNINFEQQSIFPLSLCFNSFSTPQQILNYYIILDFFDYWFSNIISDYKNNCQLTAQHSFNIFANYKKFLFNLFTIELLKLMKEQWYICPFKYAGSAIIKQNLNFIFPPATLERRVKFATEIFLESPTPLFTYYLYF